MQKSVKVEAEDEKTALNKGYKLLKNELSDEISKDELSIELLDIFNLIYKIPSINVQSNLLDNYVDNSDYNASDLKKHVEFSIRVFEIIEEILNDSIVLRISKQSIDKIKHSRSYLEEKVDSGDEAIYGINTGFGSLYNVSVSKEDLSKLQENLVKSHACGTGEEIDPEIVKLMMILKAHALSYGNSGIQLSSVEKLCKLFNKEIIPVVYEYGSLGASGDLAPLAHMVLPMLGMGEVNYKGNKIRSEDALKAEDIKTANLGAKEGLAFLNGTQFMSAHGVVSVIKAKKLYTTIAVTNISKNKKKSNSN